MSNTVNTVNKVLKKAVKTTQIKKEQPKGTKIVIHKDKITGASKSSIILGLGDDVAVWIPRKQAWGDLLTNWVTIAIVPEWEYNVVDSDDEVIKGQTIIEIISKE